MSKGIESKATVKARNARPERAAKRSAQGILWSKIHPDRVAEFRKKCIDKRGGTGSAYTKILDEVYNPILIETDNVCITSDYHVPFTDETLIKQLLLVPETHGTKDLIIAGDLFDCDDYSRFTHLSPPACFESECEEVKNLFKRLIRVFENIYICRGNHERRWLDLNAGKMTIYQLFSLVRPNNMSEDDWNKRVHITMDDRINFIQRGQLWMSCHPKNFRQVNLSVARDLASKHRCNVIVAHGHQFCQGYDRSGELRILDGGGIFDRDALAYLRVTSCYPQTKSGFYVMKEGSVISYEGK
jgi:hypothetical protein